MRILILSNLFPNPAQPDRAPFNRQQFAALAGDHEVRIVAPIAWTSTAAWRTPRRRRLADGTIVEHPVYLFTPRCFRGRYGRFMHSSVRAAFRRAATEFRPEIVLGSWAYPDGWAAAELAAELNLPLGIKVHGSDVHGLGGDGVRLRRTREALGKADVVIAVSEELAARCRDLGVAPARLRVVKNGVDGERFSPGDRDAARRQLQIPLDLKLVLSVGNLVPVKGFDILTDAIDSLVASVPGLRAVVIGRGPMRAALEATARRRAVPIAFVGAKPHDELPLWYRAADLVVLPSRAEGIPNVLLEASSCGRPWVASHVGGVPEIAGENQLVPAGDAVKFAEAIRRALLTPTPDGIRALPRVPSWIDSARELADALRSCRRAEHVGSVRKAAA
jgi:teichuronic acid biosynthesis glycosyltransferase TuaC